MMTEQEIINTIRRTPILERLEKAQGMVPGLSTPVSPRDEDFFIVQTLKDAAEYLSAVKESDKVKLARRDERQKTLDDCLFALHSFFWPVYLVNLRERLKKLIISTVLEE